MTAITTRLDRIGPWRFAAACVGAAFSVLYLISGVASALRVDGHGLIGAGLPLGRDFVAFWSASSLALAGGPEAVFDPARLHAAEVAAVGGPVPMTAWHYPPIFLLFVLPLALLPYATALVLWLFLPVVALWLALRSLFASATAAWLLILFPAVALSLASGQNGVLTAALIAVALLTVDSRPLVSGVMFGLLTCKPHLSLLVFPALAFGGHWRALAGALATGAVLVGLTVIVFGAGPWLAFFGDIDMLARLIDGGAVPLVRMPTVYATARVLGLAAGAAQLLQAAATACAVVVLCAIWHRKAPLAWRGSALALGLPLATPYAFDFDLVVLVLPLAWLFRDALREKVPLSHEVLLAIAWASPALFWVIAVAGGPPLMPVVLATLMAVVWRRVFVPAPAPLRHALGKAA